MLYKPRKLDSVGTGVKFSIFGQTHLPVAPHWPQPFSRVQISLQQDPSLHSRPRSLRKESDCSRHLIRGQWLPSEMTPRPHYSLRSKQTSSARNLRRFRAPRLRMADGGATTGRSRGAISLQVAEGLSLPGGLRTAPQPSRPCRHRDRPTEQFSRYPETPRLGKRTDDLTAPMEASSVQDARRIRGRGCRNDSVSRLLGYEAGWGYFEFSHTRCLFSNRGPVGDLFSAGYFSPFSASNFPTYTKNSMAGSILVQLVN